jgi:hypothetical protein
MQEAVAHVVVGASVMLVERRLDVVGLGIVAFGAQALREEAGAGGGGSLFVAHSRMIR